MCVCVCVCVYVCVSSIGEGVHAPSFVINSISGYNWWRVTMTRDDAFTHALTWSYHVCGRILRTNFLLICVTVLLKVKLMRTTLLLPLYGCRWEWLVYATIVSLLAKRCGYMTNFERSVFSKVILLILVRYFQIYILYSCFMGVTGKSLDIYLKLYIFCYCEIL